MADFPTGPVVPPLFISTFGPFAGGFQMPLTGSLTSPSSATWPVANTAFYIPIALPFGYNVRRVWWMNGTSITSTNRDFGIYTADGNRLYSTTSTAAAGTSVPQYTDVTDFYLEPGSYYFGLSCSSITANRGGEASTTPSVSSLRAAGVLQEASALPLPATMTGTTVANSCYPHCGITSTASGFA